jgi:hypothetical protein
MARPRVFVSSTYYDLKHIRASLESFIESLGYDAVLSERGDIAYMPEVALDESCYREAAAADLFVLVVGGRYGSAASSSDLMKRPEFYDRYDSITRRELEAAQDHEIPTFVLIESGVNAEYQTYSKNKLNQEIKYAHVDSVNVFKFIEHLFGRSRNNPVFTFDRATQIEGWLREQWSGLFRELLRQRTQERQLLALTAQVGELKSVNETLRNYLEAVLSKVTPDAAAALIETENKKLEQAKRAFELSKNKFYQYLDNRTELDDGEIRELLAKPNTADGAVQVVEEALQESGSLTDRGTPLRRSESAQADFNEARRLLECKEIDFATLDVPGNLTALAVSDAPYRRPGRRMSQRSSE